MENLFCNINLDDIDEEFIHEGYNGKYLNFVIWMNKKGKDNGFTITQSRKIGLDGVPIGRAFKRTELKNRKKDVQNG